jgi:hypothetical protein
MLRSIFFVFAVATVCTAQGPVEAVDQIPNWPAPLYWQAASSHSSPPARGGRAQEDANVKPAGVTSGVAAMFVAMTPCRAVDTRSGSLPFGGPAFASGEIRAIPLPSSTSCVIPATAVAYSLNIAVVPVGTAMRWLTAWDTYGTQPNISTLNDKAGLVTSNAAVVPAGIGGGSINIFVTDATQVIVDINLDNSQIM